MVLLDQNNSTSTTIETILWCTKVHHGLSCSRGAMIVKFLNDQKSFSLSLNGRKWARPRKQSGGKGPIGCWTGMGGAGGRTTDKRGRTGMIGTVMQKLKQRGFYDSVARSGFALLATLATGQVQ
jgi:hypothetical protein